MGWAEPLVQPELHGHLAASTLTGTRVTHIERDALHPQQWQLRVEDTDGGLHVHGGFDRIVLAMPHLQTHDLLLASPCCQGHAKARGKKSGNAQHDASRSTAWAVVSAAEFHRPEVVLVENVQ